MSTSQNLDTVVIDPIPPQLPKKFLSNLRKHACMVGVHAGFSDKDYTKGRYNLIHRLCPIDQLMPVQNTDVRQTFLQVVSKLGYPALACEMIRLGGRIDAPDSIGQTALFHVVKEYCKVQHHMDDPDSYPTTGHHKSDTTLNFNGLTCLQMLCKATTKDWELIGLLVTHGAHDDVTGRIAYKFSKAEQRRLDELFHSGESGRPPRQCPCLSGRIVSECHGNGPTPYPSDFLCPCRSRSVHAKCCERRMVLWLEVWDEEKGILEPWRVETPVHLPLPKDTFRIVSKLMGATEDTSPPPEELCRLDDVPSVMTEIGIPPELQEKADWAAHLEDLFRMKLVDPAFAFAMTRVQWNIRPLGRRLPKSFGEFCARSYNEYVDEYIATRRDGRGKLNIEIAAKLGPSCGALSRVCEVDDCSKQEGRNVAKLKMCQKCKMTVYCGVQCQKAHWKVHKSICGTPLQTEQPLPSQRVLHESMATAVVEIVSDLIQRLKHGDPERYLQLFPEGVPADFEKDMNIPLD
ncbi:hypothetical protein BD410DRAFT_896885 [Rickenella mellea]|uniref:MYND-type domain-containing protein n=1 Tax=Rickenella mellea TaxID=50990 RepID=A0A4Y7QAB3_9AGAM|nr:hypothetical protein BD410DRAFT_896885 [Rickenella mellea]